MENYKENKVLRIINTVILMGIFVILFLNYVNSMDIKPSTMITSDKYIFRHTFWGMHRNDVCESELKMPDEIDEDYDLYKNLKLGSIISDVKYIYTRDKLVRIECKFSKETENYYSLPFFKNSLTGLYGTPEDYKTESVDMASWKYSNTEILFSIVRPEENDDPTFFMTYRPLSDWLDFKW